MAAAVAVAAVTAALAGCGGTTGTSHTHTRAAAASHRSHPAARRPRPRRPPKPSYPHVLPAALGSGSTPFVPAVTWHGRVAAWIARRGGVALLSFNQRLVTLHLHSGTVDAGAAGWRYGPAIAGRELRRLVAAFNSGFKLDVGAGGFASYGRVGAPLSDGLASVVTYADGSTDIGNWHQGVPARGRRVVSVRQNLHLLIAGGQAASNLDCLLCWGATLGGVVAPARSALGVTADGRLIWAGGEGLTVASLAQAMLDARVVRAVELDINPEWVAAYLYIHHGARRPVAVPIVPGQPGVPGQFLAPYSRDFFTLTAR